MQTPCSYYRCFYTIHYDLQNRLDIPDAEFWAAGGGGGGNQSGEGVAGDSAAEEEEVKEKEYFELKLKSVDPKSKIKVIKEVRTITGLGLKEAKEVVEKAPTMLKDSLKKDEAHQLVEALTAVGAEVELV